MKCPEDANIKANNEHDCPALFVSTDGETQFMCTRPKGHEGKHHAHDIIGNCCKIW